MLLALAILIFVASVVYGLMVEGGKGMAVTPQPISFEGHGPTLIGLTIAGVLFASWCFGW